MHNLKDKTIAELQSALAANEAEYELKAISWHNYNATKNLLELAIIDKQTGPAKRRVFRAIEPFSNRLAKKEWVGFQCDLTQLRSLKAVREFYNSWQRILAFRKIAELPEYEALSQPKPKQINAAA